MDEPDDRRADGRSKGCGCLAAALVMLLAGLPVLFIFSFGLAPCQHGPCDPTGKRNLFVATLVMLALSGLAGMGARRFTDWWAKRQAARGKDGVRQLGLAVTAFFLLVAAAIIVLLLLWS